MALVVATCKATFDVSLSKARSELFQAHFNISEHIDPRVPEPGLMQMINKLSEGMRLLLTIGRVVVSVSRDN